MLRVKVGFIGFVARVGWHSILLGRKRMHNTNFKTSFGEGSFRNEVIISRSFYDHNDVLDVVPFLSLSNLGHRQLEECRLMLQRLRRNEHVAKVISHHPFRPLLGRINTDDGEPITPNFGDARTDDSTRFL